MFYILSSTTLKTSDTVSSGSLAGSFLPRFQLESWEKSQQKKILSVSQSYQQLVNNLVRLLPQQTCLLLCHLLNILPSQRPERCSSMFSRLQFVFMLCHHFFISSLRWHSSVEQLLIERERDCGCTDGKDMEAQHTNGNCATCVGRAEILNPWEALILI